MRKTRKKTRRNRALIVLIAMLIVYLIAFIVLWSIYDLEIAYKSIGVVTIFLVVIAVFIAGANEYVLKRRTTLIENGTLLKATATVIFSLAALIAGWVIVDFKLGVIAGIIALFMGVGLSIGMHRDIGDRDYREDNADEVHRRLDLDTGDIHEHRVWRNKMEDEDH